MFSSKMYWKKIVLAVSLMAMLGMASCGAHVGGRVGSHSGEVGADVDKK